MYNSDLSYPVSFIHSIHLTSFCLNPYPLEFNTCSNKNIDLFHYDMSLWKLAGSSFASLLKTISLHSLESARKGDRRTCKTERVLPNFNKSSYRRAIHLNASSVLLGFRQDSSFQIPCSVTNNKSIFNQNSQRVLQLIIYFFIFVTQGKKSSVSENISSECSSQLGLFTP